MPDAKDGAIRLLVTMLHDIVAAYDGKDEIKLEERVIAARTYLSQVTKASGASVSERVHVGESIDVQVTRAAGN